MSVALVPAPSPFLLTPRACPTCQQSFTPRRHMRTKQKFCSPACRLIAVAPTPRARCHPSSANYKSGLCKRCWQGSDRAPLSIRRRTGFQEPKLVPPPRACSCGNACLRDDGFEITCILCGRAWTITIPV